MDLTTKYLLFATGFFIILCLIPTIILVSIKLSWNNGEDGGNDKKIIGGKISDEEKKNTSKPKQEDLFKGKSSRKKIQKKAIFKDNFPKKKLFQENAPQIIALENDHFQKIEPEKNLTQENAPQIIALENNHLKEIEPQENLAENLPVQEVIPFNNSEQNNPSQGTLIQEITPFEHLSQETSEQKLYSQFYPDHHLTLEEAEKIDQVNLQIGKLNSLSFSHETIEFYKEGVVLSREFFNIIATRQPQDYETEEDNNFERVSENQSVVRFENLPYALQNY